MPRWEYLTVLGDVAEGGEYRVTANGNPVTRDDGISFYAYLDNLGDQGWELVSVSSVDQQQSERWTFKRLLRTTG